jgi:hypothetical protein
MKLLFDSYEWRARVLPAVIVSLPAVVTLWSAFLWKDITVGGTTASGIISLAVIYALSTVVRANGVTLQQRLVKQWGGLPSTIIMRWRDSRIGKQLKQKYHDAVVRSLGLPMPTEREEARDAEKSDELIRQAFDRIRGVLRKDDPHGLWSTHNADYGFHRNLLGSRTLWLLISCIGVLLCAIMTYWHPRYVAWGGLGINVAILAGCIYMAWSSLPRGLEEAAFEYAVSAWESFLTLTSTKITRANQ